MKKIELTQGKVAIIDDEDFERASQFKWTVLSVPNQRQWYARRMTYEKGCRKHIYLHRFILNAPENLTVDHIDGNGLNNQKHNLRLCSTSQNSQNRNTSAKSATGFRGVYRHKETGSFQAQICANGKRISLGSFKTAIEAARAYDEAARKLHGEFASANLTINERFRKYLAVIPKPFF